MAEQNQLNRFYPGVVAESGGEYIASSDYADVDDLIAAIGSSGLPVLLDDTKDIDAPKVFPANALILQGGGKFTQSSTGTITAEGPLIASDMHGQIFDGFAPREVKWTGPYPLVIRPEWFGIEPNDNSAPQLTANSAAWEVLIGALQSRIPYPGAFGFQYPYSAVIQFSSAMYHFDDKLKIPPGTHVYGVPGTRLKFPANCSGIRADHPLTHASEVEDLDEASFSTTGSNSAATSNAFDITLSSPLPTEYLFGMFSYSGGTLTTPIAGQINNISLDGLTITVYVHKRFAHSGQAVSAAAPVPAATGVTFRAEMSPNGEPVIRDLTFIGTKGGTTHNISVSGMTVTRNSGEIFNSRRGYLDGLTFNYDGIEYVINDNPITSPFDVTLTRTSANHYTVVGATINEFWKYVTLTVGATPYLVYGMNIGTNQVVLSGDVSNGSTASVSGLFTGTLVIRPLRFVITKFAPSTYSLVGYATSSKWVGGTFEIDGVSATITAVSGQLVTLDADLTLPPRVHHGYITALPSGLWTNVDVRFNTFHAVDMRTSGRIENVIVDGFPGHGFYFDSLVEPTVWGFGTGPNQNNCGVKRVKAFTCSGFGIYTRAVNANNITFELPDIQNCGGAIYDGPQHPNSYYSIHTQGCFHGIICRFGIQPATFYDPYCEGDDPNFDLRDAPGTMIISGTYNLNMHGGADMYTGLGSNIFYMSAVRVARSVKSLMGSWAGRLGMMAGLGDSNLTEALFTFGAGDETANVAVGGDITAPSYPAYQMFYNQPSTGIYGLHHKVLATGVPETFTIGFSGSQAAMGAGRTVVPGLVFIDPGTRPSASSALRGLVFCERGGTGVADVLSIVVKDSADAYVWEDLTGDVTPELDIKDYLASNLSLNSGTTGTTMTDTALSLDLEVGVYGIRLWGILSLDLGGFKCDFDGGTCVLGSDYRAAFKSFPLNDTAASYIGGARTSRDQDYAITATSGVQELVVEATIDVTTAGTFIFRAAQNTSDAATTLLLWGTRFTAIPL